MDKLSRVLNRLTTSLQPDQGHEDKCAKYRDIMYIPHPVSVKHPPMPAIKRAAQFAPFAALTGLEASLRESARLTDKRPELSEDMRREIDRKLWIIQNFLPGDTPVTITYFEPDKAKDGGRYITVTGPVLSVDEFALAVNMKGGVSIPVKDICDIQSDMLPEGDIAF